MGNNIPKYLHPLEILQKKAIRIITRSPYNAHTAELFKHVKRLNILKFHDLVNLEIEKFMYQFSTKSLPNVLNTIFVANDYVHNYATRQHREPRISIHKSRQTSNSFMCRGPKIWHCLAQNIKTASSLNAFKSIVKKNYISTCQ